MNPTSITEAVDLEARKRLFRKNGPSRVAPRPPSKAATLMVGFDWGTNKSCLKASLAGSESLFADWVVPTIVGYGNEGMVENLLPGNARRFFGEQALKHRLHLRLVQPMMDGVIHDLTAARDFAQFIRSRLKPPTDAKLRAVIGLPASADRAARENLCQAVIGVFDRVILIPEPFLAALGYRDESRLESPDYVDPVQNSLFVDIGAGTTDACLVQGYYPTADDQVSQAFAGDKVDRLLAETILKTYPGCALSQHKIREIKEQHSFVGELTQPIIVNVVVGGKMRRLDVGEAVGQACGQLLQRILDAVKTIIARASSDSVAELMQNIVLTGGGSRIRGMDSELQRLLDAEGYEQPRVSVVGENYREFVAQGALKAAQQAKESQWVQVGA